MSSWFRDKIRRIVIWQERRWHVWPVLYDSQRGDMQGEMNVYYEEVLLHYPNQPLADFFDLTLSCENDIITLTDKEGEIRYLAGRAEWKKTCRKVHCTPLYTK